VIGQDAVAFVEVIKRLQAGAAVALLTIDTHWVIVRPGGSWSGRSCEPFSQSTANMPTSGITLCRCGAAAHLAIDRRAFMCPIPLNKVSLLPSADSVLRCGPFQIRARAWPK
jgi:hypothetical protein